MKYLPLFHHFEKLKPLVIGKAKNPRCFKNINIDNLPVYWESSKKAWITGYVFLQWIKKVNQVMKSQKRKILLFLDNATSHSNSLKLSNVTLRFLPPNTTSKLQPLDLGIIRAFKARYRKHMLKHLIAKIDMCDDKISLTKEINVLDAIHWVNRSWTETTIVACFRDAGILISIPPTSFSCETTFSQLKVIKPCRRTKLKSETLNDMLILKMESPKVEDFNPDDAIDIWTVSDQIKLMKLSDND